MATNISNPFTWVEIYVEDMSRAKLFYETVFDIQMVPMDAPDGMGEIEMISFPWVENERNISGALVKMESIKPGSGGTIVYLACTDCAIEESRIVSAGGQVFQPKMPLGEYGFCSLFIDSEGNTVGLYSME
jgi:predicted enzyme related to lactoylglutathione lyase